MNSAPCGCRVRLENVNRQELIRRAESSSSMHDTGSDPENNPEDENCFKPIGKHLDTRTGHVEASFSLRLVDANCVLQHSP